MNTPSFRHDSRFIDRDLSAAAPVARSSRFVRFPSEIIRTDSLDAVLRAVLVACVAISALLGALQIGAAATPSSPVASATAATPLVQAVASCPAKPVAVVEAL